MSNSDQTKSEKGLTRRSIIKGGAAGVVVAAATLAASKSSQAKEKEGGKPLAIQVESAVFTSGPGAGTSVDNFVVVGDITKVDGENASGKFFCKGVCFSDSVLGAGTPSPDAVTFVDQRFRIDGVGSILGAGAEGDGMAPSSAPDDLAVVGGTGRFVGAAGTYSSVSGGGPVPFGPGSITFKFRIKIDGD